MMSLAQCPFTTDNSNNAVHVLCWRRQSTKASADARHLAGRTEGQEGAVRWRWAARSSKSGFCRCSAFLPHTTHVDRRTCVSASAYAEHRGFMFAGGNARPPVLYQYNEGYTNAVKRPVLMKDLL